MANTKKAAAEIEAAKTNKSGLTDLAAKKVAASKTLQAQREEEAKVAKAQEEQDTKALQSQRDKDAKAAKAFRTMLNKPGEQDIMNMPIAIDFAGEDRKPGVYEFHVLKVEPFSRPSRTVAGKTNTGFIIYGCVKEYYVYLTQYSYPNVNDTLARMQKVFFGNLVGVHTLTEFNERISKIDHIVKIETKRQDNGYKRLAWDLAR